MSAINIDTQDYENRTGRMPRGKGVWRFHFGGYTYGQPLSVEFEFSGLYSAAVKEAKKALRAAQDYPGRFGNLLVVAP